MSTAPHMKAWPWFARFLCARILGHKDRNFAGPQFHYAYCIRCGHLFGNPWGGSHEVEHLKGLLEQWSHNCTGMHGSQNRCGLLPKDFTSDAKEVT